MGLTDWLPRPRPGIRLSMGERGEVLGPTMPGTVRPNGKGEMEECPGETTDGERSECEIKDRLPGETASLPRAAPIRLHVTLPSPRTRSVGGTRAHVYRFGHGARTVCGAGCRMHRTRGRLEGGMRSQR